MKINLTFDQFCIGSFGSARLWVWAFITPVNYYRVIPKMWLTINIDGACFLDSSSDRHLPAKSSNIPPTVGLRQKAPFVAERLQQMLLQVLLDLRIQFWSKTKNSIIYFVNEQQKLTQLWPYDDFISILLYNCECQYYIYKSCSYCYIMLILQNAPELWCKTDRHIVIRIVVLVVVF